MVDGRPNELSVLVSVCFTVVDITSSYAAFLYLSYNTIPYRQDEPKLILEAIANGEDIDKIGPGGQTPLMYSTLQGRANSVKFLLNNGADTGIGEKDGYTVFHGESGCRL